MRFAAKLDQMAIIGYMPSILLFEIFGLLFTDRKYIEPFWSKNSIKLPYFPLHSMLYAMR
jgi:hypothetical protein